jgi:outer membrane lipoprotein-sorting protein
MPNCLITILFSVILATSLQAQSADDILAKHFDAVNQEKLSSVNSIKITATMSMMGQEVPMTVYQKRPDKIRTEVEMQGMKITTVINGKEGWTINPMMGASEPQKIPESQMESATGDSDFFDSELFDYAGKGHTVKKLDDAEVLGKSCYVIQLNLKNGQEVKYYIDKSNFLILKTSMHVKNMGMEVDVDSYHKDYKEADDIQFARTIEVHSNGQLFQTTKIKSVEMNNDFDDSLFEKSSLTK